VSLPTLAIGLLAIAYGAYSAVMRVRRPSAFKKLEPMKARFGERLGDALHFVSYVLVPLLFGLLLTVSSFAGAPALG
jgi:hypothetical protein